MARMIPLYSASSQAEIERRAQELFEQAGRPSGRDLNYWLQAEAGYGEYLRPHSLQRTPVFNSDDYPPTV